MEFTEKANLWLPVVGGGTGNWLPAGKRELSGSWKWSKTTGDCITVYNLWKVIELYTDNGWALQSANYTLRNLWRKKRREKERTQVLVGAHSCVVPKSSAKFSFWCLGKTWDKVPPTPVDERTLQVGPVSFTPTALFSPNHWFILESGCIWAPPHQLRTVQRELGPGNGRLWKRTLPRIPGLNSKRGREMRLWGSPLPTPMPLVLSSYSCKMRNFNNCFNKHMPGPFEVLYKY